MPKNHSRADQRGAPVIREALAVLPQEPGVYLMKDSRGRVIYVGKAKRLRSRVASYARREAAPTYYRHKVLAMVERVAAVDYVVTASEKEALLLENSLIKEHRPRYNVDLRDDKTYPYFRLGLGHDYPRFSLVRRPGRDRARYFGPFENVGAARRTLRLLQRIFPLRRCSDHTLKTRPRPCLDYETGRCFAPCAGKITPEQYGEVVGQLIAFFSGRGEKVLAGLKQEMLAASREERYEAAARFRDRMQALERTLQEQRVERAGGDDLDVLALYQQEGSYRLARLRRRGGRLVEGSVHDLSRTVLEAEEAMGQALITLYGQGPPPPPLVLLSHLPAEASLLAEVLAERAGRRVELRRPRRGEKLRLLEMALANAARPRTGPTPEPGEVLARLGRKLGLAEPPRHLECLDISHLGGSLTVASVVAFAGTRPRKSAYRRYKLLNPAGPADDYAAMAEVVARRLGGDRPPPDLLLLDGGKGQLGVAGAVLAELEPRRRPALAALAKGRGRGPDRLYLPGRKNPVAFRPGDPALLLLMRLRDEAHRFAITYHRLLRRKALTRSILEEIPGVGPRKRQRLLRAFGSLRALKEAGAAEMVARAGLDRATARRVQAFLAALEQLPAELDTIQAPK